MEQSLHPEQEFNWDEIPVITRTRVLDQRLAVYYQQAAENFVDAEAFSAQKVGDSEGAKASDVEVCRIGFRNALRSARVLKKLRETLPKPNEGAIE